MIKQILILCLILSLTFQKTYYEILGLKPNANEKQIKKRYKEMARKYHPDKVKGSEKDKEVAQDRFAEINNAYETLSDPEKRQMYDMNGYQEKPQQEQGFHQQGGGSHFNFNMGGGFEDIFSSFFGGGGGQRQQQQNSRNERRGGGGGDFFGGGGDFFGGQRQGGQHHQQQQRNIFEESGIFQLSSKNIDQFFQRKEMWVLYLYSGRQMDIQEGELLVKIQQKYGETFKVAAVDCDQQKSVCSEQLQEEPKKIIVCPSRGGRSQFKKLEKILNERNLLELVESVFTPDLIKVINNEEQYKEVVRELEGRHLAILFTENVKKPSLLYKQIAEEMSSLFLRFALIQNNNKIATQNFKIKKDTKTTFLLVKNPFEYSHEQFFGELARQPIVQFLKTQATQNGAQIPFLNLKAYQEFQICGQQDNFVCVIQIIPDSQPDKNLQTLLQENIKKFKKDKIKIFLAHEKTVRKEELIDKSHNFLIIKGKRKLFLSDKQENILPVLNKIIDGYYNFQKIQEQKFFQEPSKSWW